MPRQQRISALSAIAGLTIALLSSLLFIAPPTAGATTTEGRGNLHSVATYGGWVMTANIKADGRLYTREYESADDDPEQVQVGGWRPTWTEHGAGNWASVDVVYTPETSAGADDIQAWLIATKRDGRLFTRVSRVPDQWDPWVEHGAPTWETGTSPKIAASVNGDGERQVVFGAMKQDGRLYTRLWHQATGWEGWVLHGAPTWASADVAITNQDREVWLIGTKLDGRLYTRHRTGGTNWGPFVQHGLPTWDAGTEPAISARTGSAAVFSAVKADGRLFTRLHNDSGWQAWQHHAPDVRSWAATDIALDTQGIVILSGMFDNGTLFVRAGGNGLWNSFVQLGNPTWALEQPTVSSSDGAFAIQGVKTNGLLYTRTWSVDFEGWSGWTAQGAGAWAR